MKTNAYVGVSETSETCVSYALNYEKSRPALLWEAVGKVGKPPLKGVSYVSYTPAAPAFQNRWKS